MDFREETGGFDDPLLLELMARTRGLGWWTHTQAEDWCRRKLTDGRVPLALVALLCPLGQQKRIVGALVALGLWVAVDGAYQLAGYLDRNPSRADELARRKKEADRQAKRRKGGDGEGDPPDAPPGVQGGVTPVVRGGVTAGVTADVPPDAPPGVQGGVTPLAPVPESGIQSPVQTIPDPIPPGDLSAREGVGADTARDTGGEYTRDTGVDEGADNEDAEPVRAPVIPPRPKLAEAHSRGVSSETKAPCSPSTERWNLEALERIAREHCGGLGGVELLKRIEGIAARYVRARRDSPPDSGKGFSPERCLQWLNAGAPTQLPPLGGRAPMQPKAPAGRGRGELKMVDGVLIDTKTGAPAR